MCWWSVCVLTIDIKLYACDSMYVCSSDILLCLNLTTAYICVPFVCLHSQALSSKYDAPYCSVVCTYTITLQIPPTPTGAWSRAGSDYWNTACYWGGRNGPGESTTDYCSPTPSQACLDDRLHSIAIAGVRIAYTFWHLAASDYTLTSSFHLCSFSFPFSGRWLQAAECPRHLHCCSRFV